MFQSINCGWGLRSAATSDSLLLDRQKIQDALRSVLFDERTDTMLMYGFTCRYRGISCLFGDMRNLEIVLEG